jgi:hypothetical protein
VTTIPYSPVAVTALREEMALYGVKLSPDKAWELLRKVGDRHLCVDALLMDPRPVWLVQMLKP